MLDLLAEHGARATFFVCGDSIVGREEILERCVDKGHEIGNHTTTHKPLDLLNDAAVRDEIAPTNERVAAVIGVAPRVFRPPLFQTSRSVEWVSRELGLGDPVGARIYTDDWNQPPPAAIAGAIFRACKELGTRGQIIDLHDGRPPHEPLWPGHSPNSRQSSVDALAIILPWLEAQGLRIVTVSELLAM